MAQMAYFFLFDICTFHKYQIGVKEYTRSVNAVRAMRCYSFTVEAIHRSYVPKNTYAAFRKSCELSRVPFTRGSHSFSIGRACNPHRSTLTKVEIVVKAINPQTKWRKRLCVSRSRLRRKKQTLTLMAQIAKAAIITVSSANFTARM